MNNYGYCISNLGQDHAGHDPIGLIGLPNLNTNKNLGQLNKYAYHIIGIGQMNHFFFRK